MLRLIPNCIFKAKSERRKLFIGDQVEECKDFSGLFYVLPFQKGYLVNWDVEKQIWDYMFGKDVMQVGAALQFKKFRFFNLMGIHVYIHCIISL